MGESEPADLSTPKPTHRRWVGVLLSLLISGAGIFLSGNRKAGLRWFLGLTLLSLVMMVIAPLPVIPGITAFLVLSACMTALTLWMLVLSYKPVSKLGIRGWLLFLILFGLLRVLAVPIARQFAWPFKIPTGSMEPTIERGDHFFVQASAYWFTAPSRGDVVVFRTDALDSDMLPKGQFYVKRVAALPGERVRLDGGRLLVNEQPIPGPAVLTGGNFAGLPSPLLTTTGDLYVVPPGSFFVVGDNATNSLDSRTFGAIPRRAILGRATKIYLPVGRIGDIR
jgi:signal peptidase I